LFKIKFFAPLKNARWIPGSSREKPSPLNSSREKNTHNYQNPHGQLRKSFYSQGLVKKQKEEGKEIETAIGMLKKAINEIELEKRKMIAEGEREILKMVLAIARKVIKKEIEVDSDIILRVTKDALRQVADAQKIVIKVNPLDWKRIKEVEKELLPRGSNGNTIQVEMDESIKRGGCIINTERETIDARIDQQIREIEKALMEIEGE